jgi:hypothetical protein
MSRLLFNAGVLQFRGSNAQVIDAADTASDCGCCDSLPDCILCSDSPGGPYQRMQYAVTISGFPSGTLVYQDQAAFITQTRVYTVSGLDQLNGTYNLETTDACEGPSLTIDYTVTGTVELWSHPGINYPSSNCAQTTLLTTHNYTTLRIGIFPERFSASFLPAPSPGFNLGYEANAGLVAILCESVTASAANAFKLPGGGNFLTCTGTSNFTYDISTVTTGLP